MSVRNYDLIFFHWSFTSQGLGWYKMFLVDKKEIKLQLKTPFVTILCKNCIVMNLLTMCPIESSQNGL